MMIERPAFDVDVRGIDTGTAIAVRGDMDIASIESLDSALDQALAASPRRVTLDLRGVGFVDSSGLRFLLRANARSRNEGWAFEIYRPGETAIKALAVTGVFDLLPFVDAGPGVAGFAPGDEAAATAESERTLRLEIPSTLMAPRTARVALQELLADHPLAAPHLNTLTLLVSEIVTNAVTHVEPEGEGVVEFNVTVTGRPDPRPRQRRRRGVRVARGVAAAWARRRRLRHHAARRPVLAVGDAARPGAVHRVVRARPRAAAGRRPHPRGRDQLLSLRPDRQNR